ncbi:MAG: cytochrome c biogenesis protein ResB, partial [Helicobacter japonicus]|nr:cytochrome c biogenesis protein ResB [Helicobacter japonicus]
MNIIKTLFCSMKMVLLLMGIYAIACAIATFIEKYDGTLAARLWVYDAFWFEILHLWLVACLIGCFITSKAWQRKKYASLLLHASFIVIIIGAGITRYYGFEGIMNLREGESANTISTNENYIFIQVKNPQGNVESVRIPTYIDEKVNRKINQHFKFFDKPLTLHTEEFVAKVDMSNRVMLYASIDFLGKNEKTFIMRDGNNAPTRENISMVIIEDYTIFLAWGADRIALPFSIKLNHFELERYPGSNSPASYASEVEVLDGENPPLPFRIFMNNVLDYGGYRFFQSSYHPDEKGSILSVNNDPGKIPTYIGYAMLILGVIWLLFDKNGRFATLGRFLKTQKFLSFVLCGALFTLLSPQMTYSAQAQTDFSPKDEMPLQDIPSMIKSLKNTTSLVDEFDRILVQDFGGRTKPLHTLTDEYIHKLTQKRTFQGLNPSQVFLGMLFYPQEWQSIQMIATKSPKLRQILGLDENQKYIAYIDVFTPQGQYILQNYVESANLKNPASRNTFEKDVISVDERINYAFLIYTGQVLRIFPDNKSPNNQWLTPIDAISSAIAQGDIKKTKELIDIYKILTQGMQQGIETNNWQEAINAVQNIRTFQQDNGASLLVSPAKVDSEIWLNVYNPFYQLIFPYILISIVLFIIVLVGILK